MLGGNAENIKKQITSGMLGNVEASKIQAGMDTEKIRDAKADGARREEPQEPQQHRSQQQQTVQGGRKKRKRKTGRLIRS